MTKNISNLIWTFLVFFFWSSNRWCYVLCNNKHFMSQFFVCFTVTLYVAATWRRSLCVLHTHTFACTSLSNCNAILL